ncbi:MAG: D-alanyl-D-alanine carboxypeptidase [Flavobacteriaceae bacterium]|nr:MAG: D-alanyl-D-alanine carboxypeptidase [Flavobacteriaceae bacterium]
MNTVFFTKKKVALFLIIIALQSCVSTKYKIINKAISSSLNAEVFDDSFTGFLLFNPKTGDTIYSHNANKYFTPASNTKIFTLYTSLKLLPDSIPTLKYIVINDTLYAEGTGDPSLLHPYYKDSSSIQFLKLHKNIAFHFNNYKDNKYGPGWAWEDYDWYFSPERSGLPIYGNVTTIFKTDSLTVIPQYFKNKVVEITAAKNRASTTNDFFFEPTREDTLEIPFIVHPLLTKELLEKAIQTKIAIVKEMPKGEKKIVYSIPSDSLYKRMMHQSDNFIAEQLLVLGAATLSDTLTSSIARDYILQHNLSSLKQQPRWVDGSGLSRYNLFSPEAIVDVLNRLYKDVPKDRLFHLFPAAGVNGTLKEHYKGDNIPYIYAKSGSLGNNYCLSGYLITTSGEILIFSFMNNHYRKSTSDVKKQMQGIFEHIRDSY